MSLVYFIIVILFFAYLSWTWNGTKVFGELPTRISFIIIGTLFMLFLTFILFAFSSIGIEYPKEEMVGSVRNMILLIFTPINGFVIVPQVINIIASVKDGVLSREETERKIRIILIVIAVLIIFECVYFKNIQSGMINYLRLKQ